MEDCLTDDDQQVSLRPANFASRDLLVSISDPYSLISQEQVARIQDALEVLNVSFGFSGLSLAWVDPHSDWPADILIRLDTTSQCGDAEDGVLGCTIASDQITILTKWNWYVAADPRSIASDQYDFQTVVMHELGHAVGLDHTHNAESAMFGALPRGLVRRSLRVDVGLALHSTPHEPTDQADACPVCGGSHGIHETENAPAYWDKRDDKNQRVSPANSDEVRFRAGAISQWPAGQLVETVVISIAPRLIDEESTGVGGSDRDILTGGDGVDI